MEIERSEYQGNQVIAPCGDIDMHSSPDLRETLLVLTKKKITPLFVDFKDVNYIDSSGIATFVESLKAIKSYGGQLKLVALPEEVMEIFKFSKLDSIFEIYGTLEDADNH